MTTLFAVFLHFQLSSFGCFSLLSMWGSGQIVSVGVELSFGAVLGTAPANTHTHTHLFSQLAQLTAARVPFAQVACRCDHRADTAAVGVGRRAVHLPALF